MYRHLLPVALLLALPACTFDPPRATFVLDYAIGGDRLEPESAAMGLVTRSDEFWIAETDPVFARWDRYVVELSGSERCDFCADGQLIEDNGLFVSCSGLAAGRRAFYGRPFVKLVETPLAFEEPFTPTRRLIDFPYGIAKVYSHAAGCTTQSALSEPVTPTEDVHYRLWAEVRATPPELRTTENVTGRPGDGTWVALRRVRRGEPRRDLAMLARQADARVWRFEPQGDDTKWQENFSHRLRVTEVAVRHARTGELPDPLPATLSIRDAGTCHFEATGIVNLIGCRRSADPNPVIETVEATPTYLHASRRTLTAWTVEFAAPRADAEEELALVFTVEVR